MKSAKLNSYKVGGCSNYIPPAKPVPFYQVVLGILMLNAVALLLFVAVVL